MTTITKIDITEYLLDKYQLQKAEAKALVEDFFEEIRLSLESGGEVKLSGFGNFELRNKASRPGRNPKTGESIPVSARRVVAFKPGQKLRARVENTKPKHAFLVAGSFLLFACSSGVREEYAMNYKGQIGDPIIAIAMLSEQQYEWAGTPYVLGGQSRGGIDCSGFVQKTFIDRFNINLPRTTKDQAGYGKLVRKEDIQTGDLIFFKTGRGPNGYHVGIYVKEDKFLHASTKGGVIYSSMNSPYWKKAFWQVRRV